MTYLIYFSLPLITKHWQSNRNVIASETAKTLKIKDGSSYVYIPFKEIEYLKSDKPYTAVVSANAKILSRESLKVLKTYLDNDVFLQVNRSTILNMSAVYKIVSRKNGDYDAYLENGDSVRLSRHFRGNWGGRI